MLKERNDLLERLLMIYDANKIKMQGIEHFGVRYAVNQHLDIWNDVLGLIKDRKEVYIWQGTTDPGKHATENKAGGAAHLCEGYHKEIWIVGKHAEGTDAEHEGLLQRTGRVKIWRDVNKDYIENDKVYEVGYFGINMHAAMYVRQNILLASAGCQVARDMDEHREMMSIVKASKQARFSYLLLNSDQFEI